MESRVLALSLLSVVVLASGCIGTGGGSSGGESARAITVNSFSVSPTEVYEGTSTRVSLDVENTGNLPANIHLGDDGGKVLKDYCQDIFGLEDFSIVTSGERKGSYVRMEPGDKLNLRWQLQQEGEVPLYGYECNLDLVMPFNYSVQAYKQIQIKRERDVEGSPNLYWESSSGPMRFAIETRGGTQEDPSTFVATEGGERTINVMLQLQNMGEQDYNKGVVDVSERSLVVRATRPLVLFEGFKEKKERVDLDRCDIGSGTDSLTGRNRERISCVQSQLGKGGQIKLEWGSFLPDSEAKCDVQSGEEIRMFEGESRIISCDVGLPKKSDLDSPSVISEIYGRVNYTYRRDIGTRTVRVEQRGG